MRLGGALLLVLVITGWLFPQARLWAVHALAFLHPAVAAFLLAAAAILLTPSGAHFVVWARRIPAQRIPIAVWMVFAFTVFILLRVQEPLLGDGQALLRHLEAIGRLEARGMSYVDKGQARWAELLETTLHETAFRTAAAFHPSVPADFSPTEDEQNVYAERMWFFETARWTYVILSAAAGALLCLMLARFVGRALPEAGRAVFLWSVLGTGAILLFFGYVEDYAWTTVAVAGCTLAAIEDATHPRRWPWRTAAWWAVALAMHLMTLFLLPLVAYLFLVKGNPKLQTARYAGWIPWAGAYLWLTAVVLMSLLAPGPLRKYVLPLTGAAPQQGYPLLSMRHAVDLLNLLVLVVPMITLAVVLSLRRRTHIPGLLALGIACAGGIGFLLLFDPRLGASRDWDLCSVALWPMVLTGAWVLANHPWGIQRDSLLAGLLAGVLLIPVPMVLVHAGTKSEIARLEAILVHDPARSAYEWENVAAYYRRVHDTERTVDALRHATAVDSNPHYALNLGSELRRAGRLEEAEPLYVAAAEKRPEFVQNLLFLAQSYSRQGKSEKAREMVRRMNDLEPGNPIYSRLRFQLDSLAARGGSVQATPAASFDSDSLRP